MRTAPLCTLHRRSGLERTVHRPRNRCSRRWSRASAYPWPHPSCRCPRRTACRRRIRSFRWLPRSDRHRRCCSWTSSTLLLTWHTFLEGTVCTRQRRPRRSRIQSGNRRSRRRPWCSRPKTFQVRNLGSLGRLGSSTGHWGSQRWGLAWAWTWGLAWGLAWGRRDHRTHIGKGHPMWMNPHGCYPHMCMCT